VVPTDVHGLVTLARPVIAATASGRPLQHNNWLLATTAPGTRSVNVVD